MYVNTYVICTYVPTCMLLINISYIIFYVHRLKKKFVSKAEELSEDHAKLAYYSTYVQYRKRRKF